MRELNFTEQDRILIIAPHPDDECIGTGGILIRYAKQCDVIVLTDGRQGQGDASPRQIRDIRRQEFINEMEHIGVRSYRMIEIEDGTLLSHIDCLSDIDLPDYDAVFVTGFQDEHPDHKAAFLAVGEWMKRKQGRVIPKCFTYEVHTPITEPSHFFDITDIIDRKVELVRFHKSQLKDLPYDLLVEQSAKYRAILNRMPEKRIEVYEEFLFEEDVADKVSETERLLQKERVIGWTLKHWLNHMIDGDGIAGLSDINTESGIYVYGYGEIGKLLVKTLKKEGIVIKAVIDRRAEQFANEEVQIIHVDDAKTDIPVIVTAVYDYNEINRDLSHRGFKQVYSLRGLVEC